MDIFILLNIPLGILLGLFILNITKKYRNH